MQRDEALASSISGNRSPAWDSAAAGIWSRARCVALEERRNAPPVARSTFPGKEVTPWPYVSAAAGRFPATSRPRPWRRAPQRPLRRNEEQPENTTQGASSPTPSLVPTGPSGARRYRRIEGPRRGRGTVKTAPRNSCARDGPGPGRTLDDITERLPRRRTRTTEVHVPSGVPVDEPSETRRHRGWTPPTRSTAPAPAWRARGAGCAGPPSGSIGIVDADRGTHHLFRKRAIYRVQPGQGLPRGHAVVRETLAGNRRGRHGRRQRRRALPAGHGAERRHRRARR
jgi:hypothetical protein